MEKKDFRCACGKTYTQQPNLSRHRKVCNIKESDAELNENKLQIKGVDYNNRLQIKKLECNYYLELQALEYKYKLQLKELNLNYQFNLLNVNKNELFYRKANEKHNNYYIYNKVNYINGSTDVTITCIKHGDFTVAPYNHLAGQGCPQCFKHKYYSLGQIQWLNFIQLKDNISIQHAENIGEFKIPNTTFKADGYCKETNTIYEYYGDYWHGNPNVFLQTDIHPVIKKTYGEIYKNTLNREQQIRNMGFNLIVIWENDWIKLNKCVKILQNKFKKSQ
jgi:hypothetical protein